MNAWDDELHFNTQASSQWDSLLHYAHQPTGTFYNGAKPTSEELERGSEKLPSLDCWHKRGGVVGRGVLLDYCAWAAAKGVRYSVFERHAITVQALEEVAAWQGTELRRGDILLVRTGWLEEMVALGSNEKRMEAMKAGGGAMIGIQGTKDSAAWFWDKRFAGVAADNVSLEVMPPEREDGSLGSHLELGEFEYCYVSGGDGVLTMYASAASVLFVFLWVAYWGDVGVEGVG